MERNSEKKTCYSANEAGEGRSMTDYKNITPAMLLSAAEIIKELEAAHEIDIRGTVSGNVLLYIYVYSSFDEPYRGRRYRWDDSISRFVFSGDFEEI